MKSPVNSKKISFVIFSTIVFGLVVVVVALWRQENGPNLVSLGSSSDYIHKQRVDGIFELSTAFNQQIILSDKAYGYALLSEKAKRDPRIDTYEEYVLWAKKMKESFPQLGTDETIIKRGASDATDLSLGENKSINFILEVDETNGVYTINEIRSYTETDMPDRRYDGNGCFLIAQELSQKSEDCPRW